MSKLLKENLLQISHYEGIGYLPIIDYGEWRVAILRYHPNLEVSEINTMQRHDETDEVFVLLDGQCILFIGEGEEQPGAIHAVNMEPLKAYNVKEGAWHTHTLSQDATVLIVENRDTTNVNSPTIPLSNEQCAFLMDQTKLLWT